MYFDANADAAMLPEAYRAFVAAQAYFGDLAAPHALGDAARNHLAQQRRRLASLLDCEDDEIVFTSGGTESSARALLGSGARHIVVSSIEHSATGKNAELLRAAGTRVEAVPVNRDGQIQVADVELKLTPSVDLVSLVLACNETGVLQPVAAIAQICRSRGILLHVDAIQAVGRTRLSFRELGVDLLSLSGHKFGAPFGVGALLVRQGVKISPWHEEASQNLPGIAGMTAALAAMPDEENRARLQFMRNLFEARVQKVFEEIEVIGARAPRLCNTSCLRVPGCEGEGLMMALDLEGMAVSTGSACASGSADASPILLAMGLTKKEARECVRVSLGNSVSGSQVEMLAAKFVEVVRRWRTIKSRGLN